MPGLKQPDDMYKPLKPPMSDMEFHNYLDSAGFMVKPSEFRLSIYQGGIESSLRRVAWRHLLNIFPENMSGRERFDYLKRKEQVSLCFLFFSLIYLMLLYCILDWSFAGFSSSQQQQDVDSDSTGLNGLSFFYFFCSIVSRKNVKQI